MLTSLTKNVREVNDWKKLRISSLGIYQDA